MEKIIYNKLIRDKIPEIIKNSGKIFDTQSMDNEEFKTYLLKKLVEEAQETRDSSEEKLIDELADVYEILDTIKVVFNIKQEEILKHQNQKREKRGGFVKQIKLLWVEKQ